MLKPITLLFTRSNSCKPEIVNAKAVVAFEYQVFTLGKFHAYFMANNLMPVAEIIPTIAVITGSDKIINTKKTTTMFQA